MSSGQRRLMCPCVPVSGSPTPRPMPARDEIGTLLPICGGASVVRPGGGDARLWLAELRACPETRARPATPTAERPRTIRPQRGKGDRINTRQIRKILHRHTHARNAASAVYRAHAALRPGPAPRVLLNSVPKAGTHLVMALLDELPDMRYSGVHLVSTDFSYETVLPGEIVHSLRTDLARKRLNRVRTGQYATAHFDFNTLLADLIVDLGFKHILVVRDPRDVAVSHMRYVVSLKRHYLHRYYTEVLRNDEERLAASIGGLRSDEYGVCLPSLDTRYGAYIEWADRADLVVRFEDLVGPIGGGSKEAQLAATGAIATICRRFLSPDELQGTAERVWGKHTATFRAGRSGTWREVLSDRHDEALRAHATRAMGMFGYD